VPHAVVRPRRITIRDAVLETDRRKVIGYRAECSCGFAGEPRERYGVARFDAYVHYHEEHGQAAIA
jgi:hypothetical protein